MVVIFQEDLADEIPSFAMLIAISELASFFVASTVDIVGREAETMGVGKSVFPRILGCNKWLNCE